MTHYIEAAPFLKPQNIQLSGSLGDKFYAVDFDGASVSNLADVQKSNIGLGLQWGLGQGGSLLVITGTEKYQDSSDKQDYNNTYVYFNFSKKWF